MKEDASTRYYHFFNKYHIYFCILGLLKVVERLVHFLNTSAAKPEFPGGLALTRKLVELQGGTIGVESEVVQGSRFTVVLPLVVAENQRLIPDSSPKKNDFAVPLNRRLYVLIGGA